MFWIYQPQGIALVLCFIFLVSFTFYKVIQIRNTIQFNIVRLNGIYQVGIISMLIGIMGTLIGKINAFKAIADAGDISPDIVALSIKESLYYSVAGLILLIFSILFYGIIKEWVNVLSIKDSKEN